MPNIKWHMTLAAAHTHHSSTQLIFQAGVNALNSATLVIAYGFGGFMPDPPTTFLFSR
jgi:hypothetical protein